MYIFFSLIVILSADSKDKKILSFERIDDHEFSSLSSFLPTRSKGRIYARNLRNDIIKANSVDFTV